MLSILIWLPGASALVAALLRGRAWAGRVVALGSLASLGLAVALIADYGGTGGGLRHVTDIVWIRALGIHYKLGVDGLNLFLVGLAGLLFAVSILAANLRTWEKPHLFFFHLGLAESAVLGALLAQDLALFVAFFDLMLIPFYFLVGVWGQGDRVRATTKLVIYTLVGSL
ncbi:MAG: NADH-quinone oxidoreductase subunit, partial [Solirubrobacteraceae bacterium]|nr:NADH-quinone oxidoreductase subunit [Solirubrobacteraceae bacterium]